ncbi:hypothetical protein C3Y87_12800 [Carbonactinospora thermoautotrophica]|nr:hypothetical protein [Carbonactinospora thermoautotrophica]
MVVSAVTGAPVRGLTLDPATEREVYRQAGELLRRLHQAAPARPDQRRVADLAARGRLWVHRAASLHLLSPGEVDLLRGLVDELADAGPQPVTPTHGDYQPRN